MAEYVIAPGAQVTIIGRGTLTAGMPIPAEWGPDVIEANRKAGGIVAVPASRSEQRRKAVQEEDRQ